MIEQTQTRPSLSHSQGHGWTFKIAALLLVLVSGLAGTGLAYWWSRDPQPKDSKDSSAATVDASQLFRDTFRGWQKPDLVLAITGQQLGYLLPCGCSSPQVGGLERRYNFYKQLKTAGWPYVAVDLGDVAQRQGPYELPNLQGLIKYRYSLTALKLMDYQAVGFGESEGNLSLTRVLPEYALQQEQPRVVSANLIEPERHFPEMTKPWELSVRGGFRVGTTCVLGPTIAEQVMGNRVVDLIKKAKTDPTARAELEKEPVRFRNTPESLNTVLVEMDKARVELPVLLYQGPLTRSAKSESPTEALACAKAYPQFRIIVCLSEETEPSFKPEVVVSKTGNRSLIVTVGKKGKYVGVVGVWRTGKADDPFRFDYRPVEMSEKWMTPAEEVKGHRLNELIEDYTREVKRDNYLGKYGQVKHLLQAMPAVPGLKNADSPRFLGSQACRRCHESAYEVWEKSAHAHAYKTLEEKGKPANRNYDPECIICHTIGFAYESGFRDGKSTAHLKNVGCESCHGPGSVHASNPMNAEWRLRMNPWKQPAKETPDEAARRKLRMDLSCQKCHDAENDVHWSRVGFDKKWKGIAHPTPPEERRPIQ